MTQDDYIYSVVILKLNGTVIGHVAAKADWEPALEWAHLVGIRLGRLPAVTSLGHAVIEPVWHSKVGAPCVEAFRAVILGNGRCGRGESAAEPFACPIPVEYFGELAEKTSASFVKSGALQEAEEFSYAVTAQPAPVDRARLAERPGETSVEEVAQPLPLRAVSLPDLLAASREVGPRNPLDLPVLIPRRVLDETAELSRAAGANETGGCLIGHLRRDTESPELAVEITEQIPAPADAGLTRLRFSAATWTAVRAAIDLRRNGEIMLGWWHSHSFMKETCKKCEKTGEKKDGCGAHASFFSAADVNVHRTVFRRAFNVALLVAESPCAPLTWSLYGWRHGMVALRNFHLVNGEAENQRPAVH